MRSKAPEASKPRSPVTILSRKVATDVDSEHLSVLRRPWRRVDDARHPERILVMRKRNYKVYAELGLTSQFMVRQLTVLDAGAGPSLINSDIIPSAFGSNIRYGTVLQITDANSNPLQTAGTIELLVRLENCLSKVEFIVTKALAAPVLLGCDFCDKYMDAIMPRRKRVELLDGTAVPIVRKPLKRAGKTKAPLPVAQEYPAEERRASDKIRVAQTVTVQPETQTWVTVHSEVLGTRLVQPASSLCERYQVALANGVVHVDPHHPFQVLIANFSDQPVRLVKGQVIGNALPHPALLYPRKWRWPK